ncbi:sigma-70 family RNA polymerase sigma factor [Fibrella sp. USSR17]
MKKFTLFNSKTQPCESGQDEQVWQAFKRGDALAYADLVNIYYPILLKYGLRFSNDADVVKDCLHNLFIDIWNRRERLNEVRSIKAYLLTSLRRQLYKEIQRSQRIFSVDTSFDEYDFQVQFAIETDIIDKERNDENLSKLKANLAQLSKRQREAIYLRFYQALDYEDIAQIMAINQHSAVNLIYEALKLLRKYWVSLFMVIHFTCL